jgi:hypothetical protein
LVAGLLGVLLAGVVTDVLLSGVMAVLVAAAVAVFSPMLLVTVRTVRLDSRANTSLAAARREARWEGQPAAVTSPAESGTPTGDVLADDLSDDVRGAA